MRRRNTNKMKRSNILLQLFTRYAFSKQRFKQDSVNTHQHELNSCVGEKTTA